MYAKELIKKVREMHLPIEHTDIIVNFITESFFAGFEKGYNEGFEDGYSKACED